MKRTAVYIHGLGGTAAEGESYRKFFSANEELIGFDYRARSPEAAVEEFPRFFQTLGRRELVLIANSIGAYYALLSLAAVPLRKALLIAPIVDMEGLIRRRLAAGGWDEEALRRAGRIEVAAGEALSWDYLCWVRQHPIRWRQPTAILAGDRDELSPPATLGAFAAATGARLTLMPAGEHWFHTAAQRRFRDDWLRREL